MKPKNKRFLTLTSLMLVFVAGCIIIFYNLRSNLVFFFSPSEVLEQNISSDKKIRLGGMVKNGSVKREFIEEEEKKIQEISFIITDFKEEIEVFHKGILPDLFSEGQGVVVEGYYLKNLKFDARLVLAKHDENYMPPELKNLNLKEN